MQADPQRVLMTADTVGGVWTYALDLIRALAPYGVEFALATMGEPLSAAQREQVRRFENVQVFESRYKLEWMDDPWADVERAGDWLLTIEDRVEPDVVHLNGYAHGSLPWRAPHMVVGHSCVLSWWRAVRREMAPESWNAYRSAVARGLQAAGLVAAPTRAMMAELQTCYGPLPNTAVIPNGRTPDAYRGTQKKPFVIAAGRLWDEAKNISALDVVANRLGWPVFVAGDARHPNGNTFLPRSVRLLGKLAEDELGAHFAAASIYALPARYEPFGLSVVEAALSCCALVLGDIPSLRENWDGAAIFVPPDDTAVLESALLELIGCERRRNSVAAAGYERARSFTPEKMAAGYLCAYRQLIDIATPEVVVVH